MRYTKPALRVVRNAVDAIRGGKGIPVQNDAAAPHPFNATAAAYEADE